MAEELFGDPGGIRSLLLLLKEHGGAINSDLMARGWRRRDIGRGLSWGDLRDFVEGLPPTGDSALYRARHPQSWWVTPEVRFLAMVIHVLHLANWQRGGGKKSGSPTPKPIELPVDRELAVKSADELKLKRREQAALLRRRRERSTERKRTRARR